MPWHLCRLFHINRLHHFVLSIHYTYVFITAALVPWLFYFKLNRMKLLPLEVKIVWTLVVLCSSSNIRPSYIVMDVLSSKALGHWKDGTLSSEGWALAFSILRFQVILDFFSWYFNCRSGMKIVNLILNMYYVSYKWYRLSLDVDILDVYFHPSL